MVRAVLVQVGLLVLAGAIDSVQVCYAGSFLSNAHDHVLDSGAVQVANWSDRSSIWLTGVRLLRRV